MSLYMRLLIGFRLRAMAIGELCCGINLILVCV